MDRSDFIDIAAHGADYWNSWYANNRGLEIDFSGTDFRIAPNNAVDFDGFRLGVQTKFDHAIFRDGMSFAGASIGISTSFRDARFAGAVSFKGARFGDNVSFRSATFEKSAIFAESHFGEKADFSEVTFRFAVDFSETEFGQEAQFSKVVFKGAADFQRARIGDAASLKEIFSGGQMSFDNARVGENTTFEGAVFQNRFLCSSASFKDEAGFDHVSFRRDATFLNSSFGSGSRFIGTTFGDRTRFEGASFGQINWFKGATFQEWTSFRGAKFSSGANFEGVVFRKDAVFDADKSHPDHAARAILDDIDFSRVQFLGKASFCDREFSGAANFSAARFGEPPDFRATKQPENLDWTGVQFTFGGHLGVGSLQIPTPGWTTKSETVTRLRRLRGIATQIHAVDAERDLFILERKAERGVLWKDWWRGGWKSWVFGWMRPVVPTVLLLWYSLLSGCGRLVPLPLIWLVVSNSLFYHLYLNLYHNLIGRPLFLSVRKDILDFTLASSLPFGATARPIFQAAIGNLFGVDGKGEISIPWEFQVASASQAAVNIVLIFLFGLTIRNYLKVK